MYTLRGQAVWLGVLRRFIAEICGRGDMPFAGVLHGFVADNYLFG